MAIRVNPKTKAIRRDATPTVPTARPKRRRGADLAYYSVPPDQRASDVRIYSRDGQLLRTEPPYRELGYDDPRRPRSRFEQHHYGTLNLERTPNPKRQTPADPAHPSADANHT